MRTSRTTNSGHCRFARATAALAQIASTLNSRFIDPPRQMACAVARHLLFSRPHSAAMELLVDVVLLAEHEIGPRLGSVRVRSLVR